MLESSSRVVRACAATGPTLLVVLLCSCRSPSGTRVALRLLPDGTEKLSSQVKPFDEVEVAKWTFDSPEAIAEWKQERMDIEYVPTKDGLLVRSSSTDPTIYREDLSLDASRVRVIQVRSSALTSDAFMQLFWAPPGQPFSEENSLAVYRDDMTGSLVPTYTFPVWRHPAWNGIVGRIRLDPTSIPDRRMELFSISALDLSVRDELVAPLLERSFRVDLHGDVRRAVLSPPGFPFTRELKVPRQAKLRVGYGLEQNVNQPVRFRITAVERNQTTTLMDETLASCESGEPCRWHDKVLDLAPLARRRVTLRFETESPMPLDLLRGFPAFADLEVVVPGARRPRPNVVVIVLDTLRADRLSLDGYARQTTPHIDAWARERGVVFDRVVAQAPWTLPSHVSLFTGLDALSHGTNTDEACSESLVMLAERLRDAGYTTQAITGGAYLATEYAVMQGFDHLHYFFEPRVDPDQTGNDIVQGVRRAEAWLGEVTDRPFFLFFHTYEIHSPYDAREPYFDRFHGGRSEGTAPQLSTTPKEAVQEDGFLVRAWLRKRIPGDPTGYHPVVPEELPLLQDLYDSTVSFADEQVGRLLSRLTELGLDKNTIVIVTSDHGESLGEKGLAGHQSLQECELMVPLIIALPSGRGAGSRISTQVRLIDVAPTLLDLLRLDGAPAMDGSSLMQLVGGRSSEFPDHAWSYAGSSNFGLGLRIANVLKYTYNNAPWPPIRGAEGLFRLDRDPQESQNLASQDPRTAGFRAEARRHYESATSGVRIRYANHSSVPMVCELWGRLVNPLQVKDFDQLIQDVSWHWQTFQFTVPPRVETTLFLEGRVYGEILVGADLPGLCPPDECLKEVVSLDVLDAPWQVTHSNDAVGLWSRVQDADADQGATSVRLWIAGDQACRAGEPGVISRELHDELRNLGYVQ